MAEEERENKKRDKKLKGNEREKLKRNEQQKVRNNVRSNQRSCEQNNTIHLTFMYRFRRFAAVSIPGVALQKFAIVKIEWSFVSICIDRFSNEITRRFILAFKTKPLP